MAKTPKAPFASLRRPTDSELRDSIRPVPFKKCCSCGRSVISSVEYCSECARLIELGMAKAQPQFVQYNPGQDTQQKQSHTAFDRSGYRDTIPNTKFPPTKGRM